MRFAQRRRDAEEFKSETPSAIGGPLQLLLNNETGAPCTNTSGTTASGVPFVFVNPPGGSLGVGQSVSVTLTFNSSPFGFNPQLLSDVFQIQ
jgi:hypothetical protein